jgi:hypothetical protein
MLRRVEPRNLLRSIHGNYLRAIVGSMKMTPMEVLEVALCQAPLDLAAIEAAGLTVYRMSGRMEEYRTGSYKD